MFLSRFRIFCSIWQLDGGKAKNGKFCNRCIEIVTLQYKFKQLQSQILRIMEGNPIKCKIVLLGDQSVGKTSIINRFIFDNFTGHEQPTVGVDFVSKTVNVQNKSLRMQLWDTAGQQRFHSLIPSYIKDCNAAVIVYDITNANSYHNLSKWIDNVREVRGEEALILIIGNKKDLEQERAVQTSVAADEFKKLGLTFMEVSAKTGVNVKQFFKDLAFMTAGGKKNKQQAVARQQSNTAQQHQPQAHPSNNQGVSLTTGSHNQKSKKDKKGCC